MRASRVAIPIHRRATINDDSWCFASALDVSGDERADGKEQGSGRLAGTLAEFDELLGSDALVTVDREERLVGHFADDRVVLMRLVEVSDVARLRVFRRRKLR